MRQNGSEAELAADDALREALEAALSDKMLGASLPVRSVSGYFDLFILDSETVTVIVADLMLPVVAELLRKQSEPAPRNDPGCEWCIKDPRQPHSMHQPVSFDLDDHDEELETIGVSSAAHRSLLAELESCRSELVSCRSGRDTEKAAANERDLGADELRANLRAMAGRWASWEPHGWSPGPLFGSGQVATAKGCAEEVLALLGEVAPSSTCAYPDGDQDCDPALCPPDCFEGAVTRKASAASSPVAAIPAPNQEDAQ